jgi:hypothetical protein
MTARGHEADAVHAASIRDSFRYHEAKQHERIDSIENGVEVGHDRVLEEKRKLRAEYFGGLQSKKGFEGLHLA